MKVLVNFVMAPIAKGGKVVALGAETSDRKWYEYDVSKEAAYQILQILHKEAERR
jgi:hypothetical protein